MCSSEPLGISKSTGDALLGIGAIAGGAYLAGPAGLGLWGGTEAGVGASALSSGLTAEAFGGASMGAAAGVGLTAEAAGMLGGGIMAGGAGAGASSAMAGWGSLGSIASTGMKYLPTLASVGSGLYGMSQADKMRKQAELMGKQADTWGLSGGRGLADEQLQQLMRDPAQVAAGDPAYKLRMQAAERATAQYGASGISSVQAANASTDWLNQRMTALGGLAGAGGTAGGALALQMQGAQNANDLASKSLASIGYGLGRLSGQNQVPPEVQAWLLRNQQQAGVY